MNKENQVRKTATIRGQVYAAEDSLISYGVSCLAEGEPIHIGAGSKVFENSVLKSTQDYPVKIGQKTHIGHGCKITGADIGSLCEIGNGVQIGEGCYIGDYAILGEGTILPPGAKVASRAVVLGHPFYTIRGLTVEDKEMIASMRGGDVSLSKEPLSLLEAQEASDSVEALIAFEGTLPQVKAPSLGQRVEIIGDVQIDEGALIEEDVKIIGDSHGPVRIGKNVHIGAGTVIHLLPGGETLIGDNVRIGKNCLIHGCQLEEGAVVENHSIICDKATIGRGATIKEASLVPQRREIPAGASLGGYPVEKM